MILIVSGMVEMADGMRSEGKIYVVVAVLVLILAGLLLYLNRIERKITKMENKLDKEDKEKQV